MEKDELTLISITAPLFGEVARIEFDSQQMLVVNKMGHTYSIIDLEKLNKLYPGGQTDFQNFILGRVTLMGHGALRKRDTDKVDVYDPETSQWMIVPVDQPDEAAYFYFVNKQNYSLEQLSVVADDEETQLSCYYKWRQDGSYVMDFSGQMGTHSMSGTLSFNAPAWGAAPMERFQITSKFRQVPVKDLLKGM